MVETTSERDEVEIVVEPSVNPTPARRPLSPASSVSFENEADSFYEFVDVLDPSAPALSDHDMNSNDHARHRRELLDLVNRLRAMGYACLRFLNAAA
jgi:hypothetical protein